MERDSPLKQWARKISPSKSRNKPLPPAPKRHDDLPESPTKSGSRPTSTRENSQEQVPYASGQRKSSISKMKSLFTSGNRDHNKRSSPPPQRPLTKEPHQRSKTPDILSSNSRAAISKDHIRRHSALSPGTLTQRIFALESELATTRKELARFQTTDDVLGEHRRQPARRQWDEHEGEVEARFRRLVSQGHLDGFVENLMGSPERRSRGYKASQAPDAMREMYHTSQNDRAIQQRGYHGDGSYNKGRTVSAPQTVRDDEAQESMLSAQESRAEAELKMLRSEMRQAAWEQVQEQARAQLNRQTHLYSRSQQLADDRPPSRGKDRSSSMPRETSHHAQDPSNHPALRRVARGLKKELPALPDSLHEGTATQQPTQQTKPKPSIRAVSAPLEEIEIAESPPQHEHHANFVFPSPAKEAATEDSPAEDPSPGYAAGQPRKAHRRRPSERDINFMHDSKRSRTDGPAAPQKPAPAKPQRVADQPRPVELAHLDDEGPATTSGAPSKVSKGSAPLSEVTSSRSNAAASTKRSAPEAKHKHSADETETIDLDALSTPTKKAHKPNQNSTRDENRENDELDNKRDEEDFNDESSFEMSPPDTRPPSPERRHLPRPTRLETVREDYEWDDDIF